MKKTPGKQNRPSRRARAARKVIKWVVVLGGVSLLAYGVSQMSGVAYGEKEIGVVDFSSLSSTEKRNALMAANAARCACTCGLTLAQCVATDSTCPIREENIKRIKTIVAEAHRPE